MTKVTFYCNNYIDLQLISNFCTVLNVVFFLLGDSLASELYVPMFRNFVCSVFIGGVSRKNNRDEIVGLFMQEKV